ncbi:YidC/Oxa1 family membrane protein insertase [Butyrivibrio sp. XPD2006]|uniref:YidC/Oxa1 family membrane protein insertase n=1 Tax=Butyrivibrio sp. XPD2006 TaxID=1280668 RepID=UPI0003B4DF68|nr:YidC/Oxa1 family membrane protein insertase [Butyrivibrio sp. XPD2006]
MKGVLLTQYQGKIVGPVAWLLGHLMNGIFNVLNAIGIPNIGLAIIIFTIVIYLCLLPLTYKQQKFSKLQAKMSPELQAIQAKYKGKKDNDSMLAMQQETKEVYAKYGVSQTGSCLQLVIQMPILFALYRVIYSIPAYVTIVKNAFSPLVEDLLATTGASDFLMTLSSASMFKGQFTNAAFTSGDTTYIKNTFIDVLNKASTADWNSLTAQFPSLSASIENTHTALSRFNYFLGLNISDTPMYMIKTGFADKAFLLMLGGVMVPVLAALTQWINTKLMPQPATDNSKANADDPTAQMQQSMKTMNLMMPIMSAVFCLSLPAGMGIYWIAGAVIRSIQQVVINRHIDKIDIDAEIAKNTAKYKEKLEKNKTTKQMSLYANLSTKSNDLSSTNKSGISEAEKEEKLEKVKAVYNNKEIRKDSLLAKANMVKDFNEKNNK